jgi:formamidopyrimidine-DNA glycosylase
MPELPDLAHIEAKLRPALVGQQIADARTGDPTVLRMMVDEPLGAALRARHITSVDRRGHFMRFGIEGDRVIVINAMLVGKYRLLAPAELEGKKDPRALGLALALAPRRAKAGPPPKPSPSGTSARTAHPATPASGGLVAGGSEPSEGSELDIVELHYIDDKRMGKVYVARAADENQIPVYGQLGIDVTSPAFTREAFGAILRKRRDQTRMFLMDKRALASIGNAYADEILFEAGIHPKTFCNKLSPAEADALYAAIPSVLRHAIDEIARRDPPIDEKLRDFLSVRGRDGKPCPKCGTKIRAVRVGDGDACFCPKCQPTERKLFVDWSNLPAK